MLEITAAAPSHAGRYTCSARNPAGVAHKHISLTVQGRLSKDMLNMKHEDTYNKDFVSPMRSRAPRDQADGRGSASGVASRDDSAL